MGPSPGAVEGRGRGRGRGERPRPYMTSPPPHAAWATDAFEGFTVVGSFALLKEEKKVVTQRSDQDLEGLKSEWKTWIDDVDSGKDPKASSQQLCPHGTGEPGKTTVHATLDLKRLACGLVLSDRIHFDDFFYDVRPSILKAVGEKEESLASSVCIKKSKQLSNILRNILFTNAYSSPHNRRKADKVRWTSSEIKSHLTFALVGEPLVSSVPPEAISASACHKCAGCESAGAGQPLPSSPYSCVLLDVAHLLWQKNAMRHVLNAIVHGVPFVSWPAFAEAFLYQTKWHDLEASLNKLKSSHDGSDTFGVHPPPRAYGLGVLSAVALRSVYAGSLAEDAGAGASPENVWCKEIMAELGRVAGNGSTTSILAPLAKKRADTIRGVLAQALPTAFTDKSCGVVRDFATAHGGIPFFNPSGLLAAGQDGAPPRDWYGDIPVTIMHNYRPKEVTSGSHALSWVPPTPPALLEAVAHPDLISCMQGDARVPYIFEHIVKWVTGRSEAAEVDESTENVVYVAFVAPPKDDPIIKAYHESLPGLTSLQLYVGLAENGVRDRWISSAGATHIQRVGAACIGAREDLLHSVLSRCGPSRILVTVLKAVEGASDKTKNLLGQAEERLIRVLGGQSPGGLNTKAGSSKTEND